ncbi:MAG TPA: hypothetical protein VH373_24525 [Jatrophihabitantaceae bacterium]|jgi:hypothetical protein
MSRTIEIKLTDRGYEVTAGGETTTFQRFDEAATFAGSRFARLQEIQAMSARIE